MTTTLLISLAVLNLLLFGGFGMVSFKEGERRAATLATLFALLGSGLLALGTFLPASFQAFILLTVIGAGIVALILFLLPVGRVDRLRDVPIQTLRRTRHHVRTRALAAGE